MDVKRQPPAPTKTERVAQRLRHEISTGVIPPGGRLEQRDVAARYGTSATPVREALRQLAAEGILVHTPNAGVTVAQLSADRLDEYREIYLMRRALESLATEEAHQQFSRAGLADLRRLHEAFEAATAGEDRAGLRTLNYSFHMRIYAAADAPRLLRSIEQLWMLFPWETLWLNPEEGHSARQHLAILEALENGTPADAAARMVTHIDEGYGTLVRYLEQSSKDDVETT